jgi:hypothetical protein
MDPDMQKEVAASLQAHRELGSDYDGAIAEGLVERIGAEVDRRVDERLGRGRSEGPVGRPAWAGIAMALGSLAFGIGASGVVLDAGTAINSTGSTVHSPSGAQIGLDALVWVVIGAVNFAWARRR